MYWISQKKCAVKDLSRYGDREMQQVIEYRLHVTELKCGSIYCNFLSMS